MRNETETTNVRASKDETLRFISFYNYFSSTTVAQNKKGLIETNPLWVRETWFASSVVRLPPSLVHAGNESTLRSHAQRMTGTLVGTDR